MKIEKWSCSERKEIHRSIVFRHYQVETTNPVTKEVAPFDLVACAPWVNTFALTKNHEIIMVRQYRHGIDDITLEIPGGAFDPRQEEALEGAKRELREETGYSASEWIDLGRLAANPAFMTNYCTTFMAFNAELTHPQELDPMEVIEVVPIKISEFFEQVRSRAINHSLIVAAGLLFINGLKEHRPELLKGII